MRAGLTRVTVALMATMPGTRPDRRDLLVALGLGVAAQLEVWIWWVEDEQGPKVARRAGRSR